MGDFETWDEYNFMWTQWKSNKIINGLKSYKEIEKQNDEAEQSTALNTDKDSGSSTENLINTPKRHPTLSALKK